MHNLEDFFRNKDILVTGGCGSIGSEIINQLLQYSVKRVRVFDHNESGHFHLQERLAGHKKLRILVGDIRDKDRMKRAVNDVDIIFHAAALKHVPICEYNPFEAVATNVYGTQNIVDAAREENIEKFIAISTDKAANPINTMGATKLLSEKLVLNAPVGLSKTLFSCVRFGNVLNSDGSVIPIFKNQIRSGGPVTITSEDMVRFFMTNREAVNLILKAAHMMKGREIFIPKMNALRIAELAEVMIEELAPRYSLKPKNIDIKTIGIRPGEKLCELLMTEEEAVHVEEKDGMFIIRSESIGPHYIEKGITSEPLERKYYDASKATLLEKDEIKSLLRSTNIL